MVCVDHLTFNPTYVNRWQAVGAVRCPLGMFFVVCAGPRQTACRVFAAACLPTSADAQSPPPDARRPTPVPQLALITSASTSTPGPPPRDCYLRPEIAQTQVNICHPEILLNQFQPRHHYWIMRRNNTYAISRNIAVN